MANRQALRELQERLAHRLQAARANELQGASWLAVQLSGHRYLVPLDQSGEIFPWQQLLRVPYTQYYFFGVANLRGNLAGVVDLGHFLQHPIERSEQSLQEVSLLTMNPLLQSNTALVIDSLQGLRAPSDFVSTELVAQDEQALSLVDAIYTDKAGDEWSLLNLQRLVQLPDFLNVRV